LKNKLQNFIHNIFYWFKRKFWQIKNLIKWFPIIWKQYDFDYSYAIEVFKFQLNKTADFLDSNNSVGANAKYKAEKIRTITKLMDKVYEEEYACEYQGIFEKKYGKKSLSNIGKSSLVYKFEDLEYNQKNKRMIMLESISKQKVINENLLSIRQNYFNNLFEESQKKQEKSHKVLWKLIENNIQNFWD
jgi:hypothetical protein